jgi:hypothetical protein
MPLLDLKTDLKSLKYGNDTPGGGNSGQPYIQTEIGGGPTPLSYLARNPFFRTVIGREAASSIGSLIDKAGKFDDGLVRGGIISSVNSSILDTVRIGKFLTDASRGPLFIIKQVGLQLTNPQLEAKLVKTNRPTSGQGFFNNTINFIANTAGKIENAVGPTRIYNLGINTLAQVPVNAIGGHIVRHGFLPKRDESKDYINVVKTNAGLEDNSIKTATEYNRLLNLSNNFNLGPWGANKYGVTKKEQGTLNTLFGQLAGNANPIGAAILGGVTGIFNTNKELEISNYISGPGSVYGIGTTIIRRAMDSDTENKEKIELAKEQSTQLAGKTRDEDNNIQEVNLTNDLGTGNKAISTYPDVPTDKNKIYEGISSPRFSTYQNLKAKLDQQQDIENADNAFKSNSSGFATGYVNQFGIYNNQRNGNKVDNTKGNYSTTDVGTIGYKNSYGDTYTVSNVFNNWAAVSRENRVGDFGPADTRVISGSGSSKTFETRRVNRADSVNLTPLFERDKYWSGDGESLKSDWVAIDGVNYNTRDLVKFRIQAINTDSPDLGNYMVFRALLTSFSDSVNSQWNDIKYAGRGNPFYVYTGFTRKISVGFKVAALSAEEMRPMYSKLNYLMSSLMPDYDNNLMRGPLHRLTVGNYLDSQFGKLDSVSYTIPNDSPWEIALDEPEGGVRQLILPHIIEVQMDFTPIGAETQRVNKIEAKTKDDSTSFIAQNNTGTDAETIQYYSSFYKP